MVTDNCSSTGYVTGEWQESDIENIANLNISLKINGEIVEKGNSSAILDNPFKSVVELSRLALEAGLTVKKDKLF